MKYWIRDLESALRKHFYDDEVTEIVNYYTEMIEERKARGESVEDILKSYDIKDIVRHMTPDVLIRRVNDTHWKTSKSIRQLLVLLLSTPFLIPLGILYLVMVIVAIALIIASLSILFSSVIGVIALIVDVSSSAMGTAEMFGMVGVSLMGFSFAILLGIGLYQFVWVLSKKMLVLFSRFAKRGEVS